MTRKIKRWVLRLLIVSILGAIALAVEPIRSMLIDMVAIMSHVDIDKAKEYILSFGIWAPVISAVMMILQAIAAPLPAFIITFANAAIFGWWQGALLSWSSSMAAAALCFVLSRWFGRGLTEKLASRFALEQIDLFFARHGQYAILISRLLPFVSFDVVSYAAGLTPIKTRYFLLATGIGQLPATLIYSYVGGMLTGGAQLFVTGLLTLFAVTVAIYLIKRVYHKKNITSKTPAIDPGVRL